MNLGIPGASLLFTLGFGVNIIFEPSNYPECKQTLYFDNIVMPFDLGMKCCQHGVEKYVHKLRDLNSSSGVRTAESAVPDKCSTQ